MAVEHDTQTYIDAEPNSGGNEPYGSPANAEQWYEEDTTPRRPRRRLLSPVPLALFGVILAGCGFILGVHAEKGSGSAASAGAGGFPSRSSTSGAASTAGKTSGPSGPPGSSGSTGSSKATSGTLAFLSGSTLYVTNSSGNTVKVLTSSTTSVSKTVKVKASAIRPGEQLTISGATGTGGAVTAQSITVGSLSSGQFAPTTSSASTSKTTGQTGTALFGAG